MPKVAILGSGLSAAYIYAACLDTGVEADFFTDRAFSNDKTPLIGPVKLDWVPESTKLQSYSIYLFALGDKANYLQRMGRKDNKTTFPENGRAEVQAYNPTQFLRKLQPKKNCKVTLGRFGDAEIYNIAKQYLHTFVTFPLQQSMNADKLVQYWIYALKNSLSLSLPNMVIYNATTEFNWTRFTQYWGRYMWEYSHLEYPISNLPPRPSVWAEPVKISDIAPGVKEYKSPWDNVTLVGRWSRWDKKTLAQDAYAQTKEKLKELQNGNI